MNFDFAEAIEYYGKQGAPSDQAALVQLLKEVQQQMGSISMECLIEISSAYSIAPSFLQAVVRRIPSLRMSDQHLLEVCCGPNCGKHAAIAAWAEQLKLPNLTVRFVPCMRLCGKGPNIRLDGKLYHGNTVESIMQLIKNI